MKLRSNQRRKFTVEFKALVALEALSGEQTLAVLASKYGVHPNQITQWKKQAKEGVVASFSGKAQNAGQSSEAQVKELHAKIGQLTVEKDFYNTPSPKYEQRRRRGNVDTGHPKLSIRRQCRLLHLHRSSYYHQPQGEPPQNLELMRRIDELFTDMPFFGTRQMRNMLGDLGHKASRNRVCRLMRKMGLMAVYHKPKTSEPHPEHKVYPYLLLHLAITRPNQVWCAYITYIPMKRGFQYLVAIMDWHSRAVLSWRLSNTMEADFCVAALEEAFSRHVAPEIFNPDQGSQFTSCEFTRTLRNAGVRISMDDKGRWVDNVFIERRWRSVKYEFVYLREFEAGRELW